MMHPRRLLFLMSSNGHCADVQVQCCFASTEATKTVRDWARKVTSTFTQLLNFGARMYLWWSVCTLYSIILGYQVPGESYRSWLRSSLLCSCDVIRAPITSLNIFLPKKKKKKKKELNHYRSDSYSFRLLILDVGYTECTVLVKNGISPPVPHISPPQSSPQPPAIEYYSTQTSIESLTLTEHTRQGEGRRQTSRKRPLFGRVRSGGVRVIGLCQVK